MDDVIPPSESHSLIAPSNHTPNGDEANREGGEDGEKGGVLITSFISNLVSPRSNKSGELTKRKVEAGEQDLGGGGENGGGVISNVISNLEVKDGGNKRLKMDEEEEGKGGLIDNIVSHLPTSIPGQLSFCPELKKSTYKMERKKRRNMKRLKMVAWNQVSSDQAYFTLKAQTEKEMGMDW